jgi:predicted dehydrogenase
MTTSRRSLLLAGAAAATSAQERRRIRLALIGTGHRGWAHINVIRAGGLDIEIVALADPTPEFLDKAASLAGSGVKTYSDYRKMLAEAKDLDGVLVVTPNFLHAEATIAALDRGLHVLCEKPMATTVADADRMIEAARRSGRILQIGQQFRYTPLFERMATLVKEGAIGSVQFASGNLFRGDWNPRSWRYQGKVWRFVAAATGSSLLEDGIHEIDVIHWLVGARVARVYATGGNNVLKDRDTIDHAALAIDYENGVKVDFGFCIFAPNSGPSGRELIILGTEGSMQPAGNRIALRKRTGGEPVMIDPKDATPAAVGARPAGKDEDSGTYRQLAAFLESIRTGRPPFCNGEVGRDAIQISLLAEKSIRERRAVNWAEL